MKLRNSLFALLAGSLFFVSCSSDDDNTPVASGAYANGTFVLNEGNGNPSSGTVSFINSEGVIEQDIYNAVNPDAPATGSYLQAMFFSDEYAFIISGQANRITVVDRYTFEYVASIEGFDNPRYGAVVNGKAYVTNANEFGLADNFLSVIDLEDFSTTTINLDNYAERVLAVNGKLYLTNGYFGSGTSIVVFNPANDSVETEIELGDSPNSFDEQDGALYVMGGSKISRINLSNNTISGTIELTEALAGAEDLNVDNGNIYFTIDTDVYTLPVNSTTLPTERLFGYESTSAWGGMYGFNVNNNKIYVAEGGDFSSESEVYIYSTNGTLINTYDVGVGPNSFYFNN